MKYQVPQFIETEDKIFGPLTIKQFIYVAGGAAAGFILWSLLPKFIAVLIGIPVVGFFMALAFYRHNDRPFILLVESAIKYYLGDKLYIWKRENKKIEAAKEEPEETSSDAGLDVPTLSNSNLKDLAWSLDVDEKLNN